MRAPVVKTKSLPYRFISLTGAFAAVFWTICILASYGWNVSKERAKTREVVLSTAHAYFNKDQAYRLWATTHGGVYVPVTDETPPNPYLDHVKERDIETPSGRKLTLMNPAYMLRQMMQQYSNLYGVRGHITSLNTLNPINRPDEWEAEALRSFEAGVKVVVDFTSVDGQPYLRLMHPFVTEAGCLKCHASQGYVVGDIRGGISVSTPMAPFLDIERQTLRAIRLTHAALLLLGYGSIGLVAWRAKHRTRERMRAERIIRKWAHIFESADWGVALVARDGETLETANPAFLAMHGYSDTPEKTLRLSDLPAPENAGELSPYVRLSETRRRTFESTHLRKDGTVFPVLVTITSMSNETGETGNMVLNVQDITELKTAQKEKDALHEQLVRAQRLESIGRLAGGVAHDFNNLLSAILGYTELGLLRTPPDSEVREYLVAANEAGEKAAGVARQLLAFSRKQVLETKVLNLNTVVRNMAGLLKQAVGEGVILDLSISSPVKNIIANPGQIEQVLMNLCVNARDAMPEGGRLGIETHNFEVTEERHSGPPAGQYVGLWVSDTGVGIRAEHIDKIFEPFFTTKEKDLGTGLGLAMVHGIVKQHGGHVEVHTREGEGTTFTVYFPAVPEGVRETPPRAAEELRPGNERILVVDDEPAIQALVRDALTPLGYKVCLAGSSEQAMALMEASPRPFDLLLADVILRGMSGRALAERVRTRWPQTHVILMTGYGYSETAGHEALDSSFDVLAKPLSVADLSEKLRETFDPVA